MGFLWEVIGCHVLRWCFFFWIAVLLQMLIYVQVCENIRSETVLHVFPLGMRFSGRSRHVWAIPRFLAHVNFSRFTFFYLRTLSVHAA